MSSQDSDTIIHCAVLKDPCAPADPVSVSIFSQCVSPAQPVDQVHPQASVVSLLQKCRIGPAVVADDGDAAFSNFFDNTYYGLTDFSAAGDR